MADNDQKDHLEPEARQGFASAFINHMRGSQPESRMGPRVWAVALVVVLVAGIAVGIGVLAKPHPKKPVAATQAPAAVQAPAAQGRPAPQRGSQGKVPAAANPQAYPPAGGAQQYDTTPQDGSSGPLYYPAPQGNAGPVANPQYKPAPRVAPRPAAAAPKAPAKPAAAPRKPDFTATTGYGCHESSALVFEQHGFWSSGKNGWIRLNKGGWGSNGCNGTFDAMPMSGSSTKDDADNYATWQFRTGSVTRGTCYASVFVPNDSNAEHVGGHPSTYLIYTGWTPSGTARYALQVDQVKQRNHWVTVKVPVSGGAIAVKLLSRGIDHSGGHPTYAHHAVAQVRVECYRG